MKTATSSSSIPENQTTSLISAKPPRRSLWSFFQRWEWILVALILGVVFLNSQLSPYFLNAQNISRTSSDFMEMGLMMLAMVFVIVTGNIDLSVASNLGMSASFMGWLFNMGVNIWVAALAAVMLGTLGGLLNGALIAKLKLPSLVVTLGTYAFFRGIAYVLLGDEAARGYPEAFTFIGQGKITGTLVPVPVALFVVLALIFGLVLHKTTFGRRLYAIGNNEQAARYSGVPVDRIKIIIFTLSGFMAALSAIIMAARFGSTRPDIATGMELSVITAAVLGGVDTNGGVGTMPGAVLSLALIGLMKFGMGLLNIQGQVQGIAIGLLLIFSILIPNLARQFSGKSLRPGPRAILPALGVTLLFVLFFVFFFWSRAPVIAGG
ncbi:MAG: ABC transporter permease [Chloroflexi bacterium]|nr:ABC transporter permease [Anaerolineaceae bacterium]NMB88542.1 ABC transporter permease [Chloroflexota bacterium]